MVMAPQRRGDRHAVLAFDLGGTFIKYGLFIDGALTESSQVPTPLGSAESIYSILSSVAARYDAKTPLAGIGVSLPGFIDTAAQRAVLAGALTPLYGRKVGEDLQAHLARPIPIWIENDANCAAMAERLSGAATDVEDFVLLTLGTGVGGAFFINGRIHRGKDFRAGEFGMMFTNLDAGHQTLHDLASTSALTRAVEQASGKCLEGNRTKEILGMADDPLVGPVIKRWTGYVAAAIFNVCATLDPQRVLIGGGISRDPRLLPLIATALKANRFWVDFSAQIRSCKYYNEAGLYGAYYAVTTELIAPDRGTAKPGITHIQGGK
ncbi:MAG: ROK family protein [Bifidobacteriaceae bacterium]|jgi:predicted NBD/HSP70 family sugar kinase|nr:ROK family protein [Bifidobacteriaceae bacterium]